jgi:threonine/homoserine/homoserine lactone efflux protein
MNSLFAMAGLLCVAAITPGPNNLVVLRAGMQSGLGGALPAIAGVVLGGLLMLVVIALGADGLFTAHPSFQRWIAAAGALYLAWLGMALVVRAVMANGRDSATAHALPVGTIGLIGFQFLNPKSWVMVLTALAMQPAGGLQGYLPLAGLFVLVPSLCLLFWAAFGAWLARWLVRPAVRRGVDAAMGALLVACVVFLIPLN